MTQEVPQHVRDLAVKAAELRDRCDSLAMMNQPTDPVERAKSSAEFTMAVDQFLFADRIARSAMRKWLESSST